MSQATELIVSIHVPKTGGETFRDILEALTEALELGPGYRWEPGGEIEQSADTMGQLTETMPLAFAGIVVLLIWQFNSFRRPAIIMFTLPLAFVGALLGLYGFGAPFDFFGILGLLSLVAAGFVLFAFYLKWTPWHARLHLPLFLLACPVIHLFMHRGHGGHVAAPEQCPGQIDHRKHRRQQPRQGCSQASSISSGVIRSGSSAYSQITLTAFKTSRG